MLWVVKTITAHYHIGTWITTFAMSINAVFKCEWSSMARNVLTVLLLSCIIVVTGFSVNCGRRGEAVQDSSHTITCDNITTLDVTWRLVTDPNTPPLTVGVCPASGTCTTTDSTLYQLSRDGNQSEVHVLQVERDGQSVLGQWRCQQDMTSQSCSITKVIWPPEVNRNRCDITFHEYQHTVNAECHITRVFPRAFCQWFYYRMGYNQKAVPSSYTTITNREYSIAGDHVYYETFCRIDRMPLPVLEGFYVFRVLVSPGAAEPSVDFNSTNEIRRPASPRLAQCRADYIDLSVASIDASICTCDAPDMGSPPGLLQWLHPDGRVLDSKKSPPLNLLLSAVRKEDSNRPYMCVIQHHTGRVNTTYIPRLAYGPNSVHITPAETHPHYKLQCVVGGVMPKPLITWSAQDVDVIEKEDTKADGSFFISTITFKVQRDTDVTCLVINPERPNSQMNATYLAKGAGLDATTRGPTGTATIVTLSGLEILLCIFGIFLLRWS